MYQVDASLRLETAAGGRPPIAPLIRGARVLYKQAKDQWYLGTVISSGPVRVTVLLDNDEKVVLTAPVPRTKLRQIDLNRQRKTALTDAAALALLGAKGEVIRVAKPDAELVVVSPFSKEIKLILKDTPTLTLVRLLNVWYKYNKDSKPGTNGTMKESFDAVLRNAKSAIRELKKSGILLEQKVGAVGTPIFVLLKQS